MAVYVISGTVPQFWVAMSLNMGRSPPKIATNTGSTGFSVSGSDDGQRSAGWPWTKVQGGAPQ